MYSMTGYGKSEYSDGEFYLLIEIKTVNNKNLDLNIKSPRAFISMEDCLRKTVQSKLQRGRVDLFILFKDLRETESSLSLNKNIAKNYLEMANLLNTELDVENDLTASKILRLPDVVKDESEMQSYDFLTEKVNKTLIEALDNLNLMRKTEGERLKKDLAERIATVADLVDGIKERAPLVAEEFSEKIKDRISEYLKGVEFDQARLLNEVAFFADKSNIDEEITRLYSHISQFKKLIGEDNCGKKLDFLMQEFNREANTICSKANDITVTQTALALKCEIEKIREQVQNIE